MVYLLEYFSSLLLQKKPGIAPGFIFSDTPTTKRNFNPAEEQEEELKKRIQKN